MRYLKFTIVVFFLCISTANAGEFSYDCFQSDLSCKNLFNDLVTQKFTNAYNYKKWSIFVYGDKAAFSDGSGVTYTIVGLVDANANSPFPKTWWRRVHYYQNMGNAYAENKELHTLIREAVTDMMADCDASPTCDLLK